MSRAAGDARSGYGPSPFVPDARSVGTPFTVHP